MESYSDHQLFFICSCNFNNITFKSFQKIVKVPKHAYTVASCLVYVHCPPLRFLLPPLSLSAKKNHAADWLLRPDQRSCDISEWWEEREKRDQMRRGGLGRPCFFWSFVTRSLTARFWALIFVVIAVSRLCDRLVCPLMIHPFLSLLTRAAASRDPLTRRQQRSTTRCRRWQITNLYSSTSELFWVNMIE